MDRENIGMQQNVTQITEASSVTWRIIAIEQFLTVSECWSHRVCLTNFVTNRDCVTDFQVGIPTSTILIII